MKKRNPSIKKRLVILFIILASLVVLVGEWMAGRFTAQYREDVAARNANLARSIAAALDSHLVMTRGVLYQIAEQLPPGREEATAGTGPGSLHRSHPYLEWFLAMDPDGVPCTVWPEGGENPRDTWSEIAALTGITQPQREGVVWSRPFPSPVSDHPVFGFYAPGRGECSLLALVDVQGFPGFQLVRASGETSLAVVDRDGQRIFFSGKDEIRSRIGEDGVVPVDRRFLDGPHSGSAAWGGLAGVLSSATVPDSGWSVLAFQAEEDALRILHRGRDLARIILLVMFLAGSFVTIALQAGFLKPISDLEDRVRSVASGEYEGRVEPGYRELESLAATFDAMAAAVRERERELVASQSLYRLIADNSSDVIWTADMNLKLTYISPSVERMLGVSQEEALSRPLHALLTPASWKRAEETLQAAMAADREGRPVDDWASIYLQMYRRDGSTLDVEISVQLIRDEDRRPHQLMGVARDITERVRYGQEVARSEETLKALFNAIPDILVLLGPDGTILQMNAIGARMYKQDPSKIRFTNYFTIIRDQVRDQRRERFDEVVASGRSVHFDEDVGGHYHKVSMYPVMSPDGDVEAVAVSIREVTRQKQVEEEVKLAQARLIQANKMTSLGLMVSSVAHEINNPNNFIMFNSRMVSSVWRDALPVMEAYSREHPGTAFGGLPGDEVAELVPKLLDGISEGSTVITRIVNDLKDYIRGNLQDLREEVDINQVVQAARSLLGNQISKVTNNFSMELTENLPPVTGNPQQLGQVVVNLVLNSLESLQSKGDAVTIQTGADDDTGRVYIRVVDEGEGMPEDVVASAFEPFYSTKLERGGTGLGLTISNSIVKSHDGQMEIRSRVGKGTTVSLYLPVADSA